MNLFICILAAFSTIVPQSLALPQRPACVAEWCMSRQPPQCQSSFDWQKFQDFFGNTKGKRDLDHDLGDFKRLIETIDTDFNLNTTFLAKRDDKGKGKKEWSWKDYPVISGKLSSRLADALRAAYQRFQNGESSSNGGQGHGNDGTVFQNNEGLLPPGEYTEWGLASNRGWGCEFTNNQRLVIPKKKGKYAFYTSNHYKSFFLVPAWFL